MQRLESPDGFREKKLRHLQATANGLIGLIGLIAETRVAAMRRIWE